jgi:biotin carboxyl carrier protein
VSAHRWAPGGRLIVTGDDGRVVEAVVVKLQAGRYEVWLDGERHLVEAERRRGGSGSNESEDTLVAPMPAKIVRIAAQAGDEVTDGQTLVVLESMKMELGVTAPRAGRVQSIGAEVRIGAIVPAGTVLVELVPAASS